MHVLSDGKFIQKDCNLNPAFLKLFDEIITNSVDEHRRPGSKLNNIKVTVKENTITVFDNGGIPVQKHATYDEWIPEMIFSSLKAGSNFDDTEQRLVAGTNGVGSTLTNIYSKMFRVSTSDGKKAFRQTFYDNMSRRDQPKIITYAVGFTEIYFEPDFSRFSMTHIDDDHMRALEKRCIDLAACNPNLSITFNNKLWNFKSFKSYGQMYFGENEVISDDSQRWNVCVGQSIGSFQQVSFVNGTETKDGGTHVEYITNQLIDEIRTFLKKKHKIEAKPSEIKNQLLLIVNSDVVNPQFSSQTKEKLITEVRDFGSTFTFDKNTIKKVLSSEIVKRVLDWYEQKQLAEDRKKMRELNKTAGKEKVLKLIDAKSKNRNECTLSLYEGDSASSAFRKFRDPQTQAAFPLRGKFLNISELPLSKIVENKEVKDIIAACGLRLGEKPENLRYGKILIYSDADPDGDAIAGLLFNFFGRFWPELFFENKIFRVTTPIVVCTKGQQKVQFYTQADFHAWEKSVTDIKKWNVSYKKGLAALNDTEYKEIIQNPKMFAARAIDNAELSMILNTWFAGDSIPRKEKLLKLG